MVVSYAKLGSMMLLNGGGYAYLECMYSSLSTYLFLWSMIFILKPVTLAAVATNFGHYPVCLLSNSVQASDQMSIWAHKAVVLTYS